MHMSERTETKLLTLTSIDGVVLNEHSALSKTDSHYERKEGIEEIFTPFFMEEETLEWNSSISLTTGEILKKNGINSKEYTSSGFTVHSFVIIDDTDLTIQGILNLFNHQSSVFIITTNLQHPVIRMINEGYKLNNITIITYEGEIDYEDLLKKLKKEHTIDEIRVQAGYELNLYLLEKGLIDKIYYFVAPCVIGNKDLSDIIRLNLNNTETLEDSHILLEYGKNITTTKS